MSQTVVAMNTPSSHVSKDRFCEGMRNLAGHCVVIAAYDGNERAGLTATAVCSVTAEPPRLLVCVNRDVYAHGVITRAQRLSVNLMASDQVDVAKRFAGMVPGVQGAERFVDADWSEGLDGTPVMHGAQAYFDCRLVETIQASTHDLFLCEIESIGGRLDGESALLYFAGRFSELPAAAVA